MGVREAVDEVVGLLNRKEDLERSVARLTKEKNALVEQITKKAEQVEGLTKKKNLLSGEISDLRNGKKAEEPKGKDEPEVATR